MESFQPRTIYATDEAAFYESIFTDADGTERSFYNAIVAKKRYSLSQAEGMMLEGILITSYEKSGHEGVESALIDFSYGRTTDNYH